MKKSKTFAAIACCLLMSAGADAAEKNRYFKVNIGYAVSNIKISMDRGLGVDFTIMKREHKKARRSFIDSCGPSKKETLY